MVADNDKIGQDDEYMPEVSGEEHLPVEEYTPGEEVPGEVVRPEASNVAPEASSALRKLGTALGLIVAMILVSWYLIHQQKTKLAAQAEVTPAVNVANSTNMAPASAFIAKPVAQAKVEPTKPEAVKPFTVTTAPVNPVPVKPVVAIAAPTKVVVTATAKQPEAKGAETATTKQPEAKGAETATTTKQLEANAGQLATATQVAVTDSAKQLEEQAAKMVSVAVSNPATPSSDEVDRIGTLSKQTQANESKINDLSTKLSSLDNSINTLTKSIGALEKKLSSTAKETSPTANTENKMMPGGMMSSAQSGQLVKNESYIMPSDTKHSAQQRQMAKKGNYVEPSGVRHNENYVMSHSKKHKGQGQKAVLMTRIVHPQATSGARNTSVSYVVRAIVPGRAWIESSMGGAFSVTVGDHVPGSGKVTGVNAEFGEVTLDTGDVIKYGSDDH